ncbi:MAG: hypothetical protein ACXVP0_05070 [Bacteroidia bacterium]
MSAERIWIFVLGKPLGASEVAGLQSKCTAFVSGWTAHEQQLSASVELYQDAMLVFKVNEAVYNASGCSIDKLTRFVQELEKSFGVELLNRMNVVYEKEGKARVVPASKIPELLKEQLINADTLVFDNTISSSAQLAAWKKPLKDTWLSRYLTVLS